MNLRPVLILICTLIIIPLSAQQKKTTAREASPAILFTINKKPVTVDEFIYLYKKNHQNQDTDFTRDKIDEYLKLYINFKLKVEEARRRGMDTTRAFLREFNQYKEELRKPYLPGNGLADSLTRMTYNRMKEEVRAAHILISVKPDANPSDTLHAYNRIVDLRKRILGGEDFGKVASEFSEDPSAKMNGGDLGYFTALQMVYPFENAAYTTSVGEISLPVRTRFGYHILKVFDRRPAGGEIEVAHIMIRTGEEKDNNQARDQIFSVYEQLEAGLKWEDLCRQYSEDPGTKDAGGKLRPFRLGMMSNVPEFENAAFELEKSGQYSDPFQTQYGWHIVRLERKIPLGTFEELAPSLKTRISRDERTQISRQALQARLRKDFGLKENIAIKSRILDKSDSSLAKDAWKKTLDTKTQRSVLFELNGKKFSVEDFLAQRDRSAHTFAASKDGLRADYEQFIDETILKMQEEVVGREHPEYRFLLNEYYEGILLFEIMEKEVWNKASEDSLGQRRFYEANASNYTAGPRVKATLYAASDKNLLTPLKDLLDDPSPGKLQEYVTKNKVRAESGFFGREDKAVLQKVPWETGVHSAENNGMYYLAWLKEILQAGQMSFEEARPALISDYQNQLEQSWLEALRKKFVVKINQKGHAVMLNKLEKRGS